MPNTLRDAIVRSVTGKRVMGEMNKAEYVRAAQALGMFNKAKQYLPSEFVDPAPIRTYFSQHFSPLRRWTRAFEQRGGDPLYSKMVVPMEDTMKVITISDRYWFSRMEEVAGDILKLGRSNQRNAVGNYIQGEKGAILDNRLFSPAQKANLVKKAEALDALFKEAGPHLDVPEEIFLDNYLPRIRDRGGVFSLYKDGSEIPGAKIFTSKEKRVGSTDPLMEDPYALFQIYVRGGSRAKFLTPTLEKVKPFVENLPISVRSSAQSYVLERLGYAGKIESALDKVGGAIGKKLGVGLPEDIGRQFADAQLSGMYGGLLSQPSTVGRNSLQYYLFGYGRLGDKFSIWAQSQVAKNPKAALRELADEGLSIDVTMPYGGAIASGNKSPLGNLFTQGMTAFKKGSQEIVRPISVGDNLQRAVISKQFKAQFDEAATRYNQGKITWDGFEKEMGMKKFSSVDQDIARQKIAAGDTRGARAHLARDVIDEIMFPYRRGSSARVSYGYGGKVGTALLSWPNEAAHMAVSWMKTGQWDNVVRYLAASTAMKRTMEEAFGIDFTRSLYAGPLIPNNLISPIPHVGAEIFKSLVNFPGIREATGGTRKKFNDANKEIVSTLGKILIPGSLFFENMGSFNKAYLRKNKDGTIGADKDGLYTVEGRDGKARYRTDFYGLFMGELVGFTTTESAQTSNVLRKGADLVEEKSQMRKRGMELFQQEKYVEADQIFKAYGIEVTLNDLKQYDIPVSERTIKRLPKMLQEKLLPEFQKLLDIENEMRAQP